MLRITFDGSDQRVVTALRTKGPQIVQAINSDGSVSFAGFLP
jgi:hypothetical protein